MTNIRQALNKSQALLTGHVGRPDLEAGLILAHLIDRDQAYLLSHPELPIPVETLHQLQDLAQQRVAGRPLAYILGHQEFSGRRFIVTSDVLIPRHATEFIVQAILQTSPQTSRQVLEIGTGSGAVAVTLALARPRWNIYANDISPAAIDIAQKNSINLGAQVTFILSDFQTIDILRHSDLVVANLPYLTPEEMLRPELRFEPQLALDGGGADGLNIIRQLIQVLPHHPPAGLFLECSTAQIPVITDLLIQRWPDCAPRAIQNDNATPVGVASFVK